MAKASVEAPPGWGARQLLRGQLEDLGYAVRMVGAGDAWRFELR